MKAWAILILVMVVLGVTACAPALKEPEQAQAAANPARQILVTFPDERVERVPVSNPAAGYRARGEYGNSSWSEKLSQSLARDYGLKPLTQWPITALGVHCTVYEIPAGKAMDAVLQALKQDSRVEAVQAMQSYRTLGHVYSDPYYKLQTGIQSMRVEAVHPFATGKNIAIAIIDTGLDSSHPDLSGQIALEQNFVEASPNSRDDIHGTAVAGVIAAAADNRKGIVGVAPGARLFALKACWPVAPQKSDALCDSLTLALALDKAIALKTRIINLSLAGRPDPLVERLVKKALEQNAIVVASAGEPKEDYFPASIPGVIAVKAADGANKRGEIAAPGQEILTTLPNASYNFMSGSSFAAAHVSGLIALLLELKPRLNSAQITAALQDPLPPSGLDVCATLAKLGEGSRCGIEPIQLGSRTSPLPTP